MGRAHKLHELRVPWTRKFRQGTEYWLKDYHKEQPDDSFCVDIRPMEDDAELRQKTSSDLVFSVEGANRNIRGGDGVGAHKWTKVP